MGEFVNKATKGVKLYDVVNKDAFKKIARFERSEKFSRFVMAEPYTTLEVFYDTPVNLLSRSGIILSKLSSAGKTYLKIQKQNFIPNTFRTEEEQVFIHEVGEKDSFAQHSLFLVDGVTALFSTSFSIDFENVFKTVVPKMNILTKGIPIRMLSGTGYRAKIIQLDTTYKNLETKRSNRLLSLKVESENYDMYPKQFEEVISKLEKFVKELVPIKEGEYQYAIRVTKKVVPVPREKQKKEKKVNILTRIEG